MVLGAVVLAIAAFVILRLGEDEEFDRPAVATQTAPAAGATTTASTPAPRARPSVRVIRIGDAEPSGGVAYLNSKIATPCNH